MGDFIKVALQVHRGAPAVSLLRLFSHKSDGFVLTSPFAEPEVAPGKLRIIDLIKRRMDALGYNPVHHNGDS